MIKRHLEGVCFDSNFGRQMRFITGPRQAGKTTIAKAFLKSNESLQLYFNWDLRETRDRYKADPYFCESAIYDSRKGKALPWVCFDEIHKMPKWKNILKDYFDKFENDARFVITGNAKLNIFRKSGDSLAGRYFLFTLLPLSLREVVGAGPAHVVENSSAIDFIESNISNAKYNQAALEQLLNLSGFPEPFVRSQAGFHKKWQQNLLDRVIREDLRDLTKIVELENIATVMHLLPGRIGTLLSYNSLKRDMDVSYNAVKNYLAAMQLAYIIFLIPPYSSKISRSIKKEKKCYLYDWSRCADIAKRFENYVAVELKVMTELWNDRAINEWKLFFVRTKDGKETDFLITKDGKPWMLFEAKSESLSIGKHHHKHSRLLGNIPLVQIVYKNNILKKTAPNFYQVSASRFF